MFVFGDLLFFSFPFFSFFSLLFYIFIFCLRQEGVILCYVEKEGRVVFHHNCFFCLLVCIRFCDLVSISSSSGFRRYTQTPSPGGWLFSLPNKIKISISHEFVFISLYACMFCVIVCVSFHFCFQTTRAQSPFISTLARYWFRAKLEGHGTVFF